MAGNRLTHYEAVDKARKKDNNKYWSVEICATHKQDDSILQAVLEPCYKHFKYNCLDGEEWEAHYFVSRYIDYSLAEWYKHYDNFNSAEYDEATPARSGLKSLIKYFLEYWGVEISEFSKMELILTEYNMNTTKKVFNEKDLLKLKL
jgi:hypothetical protein